MIAKFTDKHVQLVEITANPKNTGIIVIYGTTGEAVTVLKPGETVTREADVTIEGTVNGDGGTYTYL